MDLISEKNSSLVWTVTGNRALKGYWNSPKASADNLNIYVHKDPL